MLTRRESNRTMLETGKKCIGKQGYSSLNAAKTSFAEDI